MIDIAGSNNGMQCNNGYGVAAVFLSHNRPLSYKVRVLMKGLDVLQLIFC